MQRPPPVQWRVARSAAQAWAVSIAAAMNAWVLFALYGHTGAFAWWALAGAVASLFGSAYWDWFHSNLGLLTWSGERWAWSPGGPGSKAHCCGFSLVMDFQTFMLVRAQTENDLAPTRWLWLERGRTSPDAWMAMRRALVASLDAARGIPMVA